MASPLYDPWILAKTRFLDGLSDREKASFDKLTVEDVLYQASSAQKTGQEQSKAWYISAKLRPIVDAIDQYGSALDVISNSSSSILCPLWGSMKIVLQIAGEFGKFHDKLVDMFERIGDVLPRFNSYIKLFPSAAYLLHSLSLIYVDILEFCTAAKNVFVQGKNRGKSSLFSPSLKVFSKSIWKPFEKQFGDVMERFRRHKANVEREAGLSHMIEASDERRAQREERALQAQDRSLLWKQRLEAEAYRKKKKWDKILVGICPYNYGPKLSQYQRQRHAGTCDWMFDMAEYKIWSSSKKSNLLWICGKPGAGKSIIAAHVYDDQLGRAKQANENELVLYCFCDYKDPSSLVLENLVGGMIKQALLHLGDVRTPEGVLETLETFVDQSIQPEIEHLNEVFLQICRLFKQVTMIVDGIDECSEESMKSALKWFRILANFATLPIRIYLSSRDEHDIRLVTGSSAILDVSSKHLASDISIYVRELVDQSIRAGELRIVNPALADLVVDKLTKGADGMFLWVSLQLKDLCDCITEQEVSETLDHLPIGLQQTYTRALAKILSKNLDTRAYTMACKVYRIIYQAKRPLSLEELLEAISFDIGDKQMDINKVPNSEGVLKRCGHLLKHDEAEKTISFVHYTLKEFFSLPSSADSRTSAEPFRDFINTVTESRSYLADLCLTYLCFANFEGTVTRFKDSGINNKMRTAQQYISSSKLPGLPDNVLIKGFTSFTRGFRLTDPGPSGLKQPAIDFAKYLYQPEAPSIILFGHFKFLNYVTTYWLEHCKDILENDRLSQERFWNVCFERVLLFDIRPWGQRYSKGTYRYTDAFVWAIEEDHAVLIEAIFSHVDSTESLHYVNLRFEDGNTPAHVAARHGDVRLIRLMGWPSGCDNSIAFKAKNKELRTVPIVAFANNNTKVIQYFLGHHWAWVPYNTDSYGRMGPEYAVHFQNWEIVEQLVESCLHYLPTYAIENLVLEGYKHGKVAILAKLMKTAQENGLHVPIVEDTVKASLRLACVRGDVKSLDILFHYYLYAIDVPGTVSGLATDIAITALEADDCESYDAIRYLIAKGADFERVFLQILARNPLNLYELMKFGPHPNITPLIYAINKKRLDLVNIILQEGADPNETDTIGKTALHHAIQDPDSVAALIAYKADPNKQDSTGLSPIFTLISAIWDGKSVCPLYLLSDFEATFRLLVDGGGLVVPFSMIRFYDRRVPAHHMSPPIDSILQALLRVTEEDDDESSRAKKTILLNMIKIMLKRTVFEMYSLLSPIRDDEWMSTVADIVCKEEIWILRQEYDALFSDAIYRAGFDNLREYLLRIHQTKGPGALELLLRRFARGAPLLVAILLESLSEAQILPDLNSSLVSACYVLSDSHDTKMWTEQKKEDILKIIGLLIGAGADPTPNKWYLVKSYDTVLLSVLEIVANLSESFGTTVLEVMSMANTDVSLDKVYKLMIEDKSVEGVYRKSAAETATRTRALRSDIIA